MRDEWSNLAQETRPSRPRLQSNALVHQVAELGSLGVVTSTVIQSIDRGIVFLWAEWSGGAKWAHRQLVTFLEQRSFPVEQL